jgi:hypothetical protein
MSQPEPFQFAYFKRIRVLITDFCVYSWITCWSKAIIGKLYPPLPHSQLCLEPQFVYAMLGLLFEQLYCT